MIISHYDIHEPEIGGGGMCKVYRATNHQNGGAFAVKILRPELAADPLFCDRFHREARAGVKLIHPNIVRIFDNGVHEPGNIHYIVMDYLAGKSLAARLRNGRLPIADAVDFAIQTTLALSAAHAVPIIHRDLKPDNLFLVEDPLHPNAVQIKVLDFGIAKLPRTLSGGGPPTNTRMQMGTPAYMSPEQCRSSKNVDCRSDIYSLGVVLYEMLCGVPPFVVEGDGFGEYVLKHTTEPPEPPRKRNPEISEQLEQIVLKALAKRPEDRQQTAEQLRQELQAEATRLAAKAKSNKTEIANPSFVNVDSSQQTPIARRATFWETRAGLGVVVALVFAVGSAAAAALLLGRVTNSAPGHDVGTSPAAVQTPRDSAPVEAGIPTTIPATPPGAPGRCPAGQVLIPAAALPSEGGTPQAGTDAKPPDFCLDSTEVTVEAYRDFLQARSGGKPVAWPCKTRDCKGSEECNLAKALRWNKTDWDRHPMNCVDWAEAKSFCENRNTAMPARLPTALEWTTAASTSLPEVDPCTNRRGTCPVGPRRSGAKHVGSNPYLHDMLGNVMEWTGSPGTTSSLPTRSTRKVGGGSWIDEVPRSDLDDAYEVTRLTQLGFRCATPMPSRRSQE